jgi:GntR family transcriptional regulator, carbon starvation induced regulator
VEPIALREAIAHRTVEREEQVVLTCHRMSRVDRSISAETFKNNPAWEKAHCALHMALIATCPSRRLIDFCGLLSDHAARYRNVAMSVIYPARDIAGEHREIMEVAIHGEVEEATARLIVHYRRTAGIIQNSPPQGLKPETAARRKRKPE